MFYTNKTEKAFVAHHAAANGEWRIEEFYFY